MNAKIGKYESNSDSYRLMLELSKGKDYFSIDRTSYIPIPLGPQFGNLGFVEIKYNHGRAPSIGKLEEAIRKAKEVFSEPKILGVPNELSLPFSIFMVSSNFGDGAGMANDLFMKLGFTIFIDLSEWFSDQPSTSLKDLTELTNVLFFAPEIMDMSKSQREMIVLYSLLPSSIRRSSLFVHSTHSWSNIKRALGEEPSVLKHLQDIFVSKESKSGQKVLL